MEEATIVAAEVAGFIDSGLGMEYFTGSEETKSHELNQCLLFL